MVSKISKNGGVPEPKPDDVPEVEHPSAVWIGQKILRPLALFALFVGSLCVVRAAWWITDYILPSYMTGG